MARTMVPLIAVLPAGLALVAIVSFLAYRASSSVQDDAPSNVGAKASAVLVSRDGGAMGSVTLLQAATGVLVAVEVDGLEPGGHALIIHSVGACTPDFDAAGDHFDPEGAGEHGFVHPGWRGSSGGGGHGGDLPNIYAAADGSARADFFTEGVTLDAGKEHSLFDSDGSAIIVHEKPDTYGEDGEADTGSRIACGVIQPAP